MVPQPSCVGHLGGWRRHGVLGRPAASLGSHSNGGLESLPAAKPNRAVKLVGQTRDRLALNLHLHLPAHLLELQTRSPAQPPGKSVPAKAENLPPVDIGPAPFVTTKTCEPLRRP